MADVDSNTRADTAAHTTATQQAVQVADFIQANHAKTPQGIAASIENAPENLRAVLRDGERMGLLEAAVDARLKHLNPIYVAETKAAIAAVSEIAPGALGSVVDTIGVPHVEDKGAPLTEALNLSAGTTAATSTEGPTVNFIERDDLERTRAPVSPGMTGNGSGIAPRTEQKAQGDWADQYGLDAVAAKRRRDREAAQAGLADAQQPGAPSAAAGPTSGDPAAATKTADKAADKPADTAREPASGTAPLAEPPELVKKRYLHAGHRYFLKDEQNRVAFEDRGARMVTEHNRPDIAESMAAMAEAKGWKSLRVSGHEDFRREVWLQASLRGIEVNGYKPQDVDRARLDELRQQRMTNRVEEASPSAGQQKTAPAPLQKGQAVSPPEGVVPVNQAGRDTVNAARAAAVPPAPGFELLEHGHAPYQHNRENSDSYFVRMRDHAGREQTTWGVDLARALPKAGAQIGDRITLENLGRQWVTVEVPVKDKAGKTVSLEEKQVYRNAWKVDVHAPEKAPQPTDATLANPTNPVGPTVAATLATADLGAGALSDAPARAPVPVLAGPAIDLSARTPEAEFAGMLVAHGYAPYQHRAGAPSSYHATLRGADGQNVTVWGADLQRTLEASGVEAGDRVTLRNYGRHPVPIDASVRDEAGNVTGTELRKVQRYVWDAQVAPVQEKHVGPVPSVTVPKVPETAPQPAPIEPPAPPALTPEKALQLSVIGEAMRLQGFSEKSVAKVQARAEKMLDQLEAKGVDVPAPKVFDPKAPASRGPANPAPSDPTQTKQVERVLAPAAAALPSL